jgi:AcrR family transcriptional regulator
MRALPGRDSRTTLDPATTITRDSVKGEQRTRILRAVGELVAKRGYNAVTVELIVKRAKVSFKSFYAQFPNKEAAFLELFDRNVAETRADVIAALAAAGEDPWPAQIVLALRTLFEAYRDDPLLARATIVEAPTVGPVILERYQEAMIGLVPLFRLGREFNPEAAGDLPESLEETLSGGIVWSAYQRLIVGEVDRIEALLPEAIEFVLRPYLGREEAVRWAATAFEQIASDSATQS